MNKRQAYILALRTAGEILVNTPGGGHDISAALDNTGIDYAPTERDNIKYCNSMIEIGRQLIDRANRMEYKHECYTERSQ